jgi:hypothetical protein
MKVKPKSLTEGNPQLHYLLRICQAGTDASKAVDWIKKPNDLRQAHPPEGDEMTESEF